MFSNADNSIHNQTNIAQYSCSLTTSSGSTLLPAGTTMYAPSAGNCSLPINSPRGLKRIYIYCHQTFNFKISKINLNNTKFQVVPGLLQQIQFETGFL